MAIQSIGTATVAANQQLTGAAKSGGGSAGASAGTGSAAKSGGAGGGSSSKASSTTIVSETSYKNADGWTTTIITYADGHTETKTTPPTQGTSPATANNGAANRNRANRGSNVNLLV